MTMTILAAVEALRKGPNVPHREQAGEQGD
jgi:hypothetical protein